MCEHINMSALMPRSERDAAVAALVFDVFEAADEVGYAAEAATDADDEGPGAVGC